MNDEEYFESCLTDLKKTHTDEEAKAILKKFSYLYKNPSTPKVKKPINKWESKVAEKIANKNWTKRKYLYFD
jgi:hypothetical protein